LLLRLLLRLLRGGVLSRVPSTAAGDRDRPV